jgi:hypothetical protein
MRGAVRNGGVVVETGRVRLSLLAIFACFSVFLMAASPAFTIVPSVIVYPLASSPELDREASARIVTTLATQIAQGGGIKIIPSTVGITRDQYLSDARAQGANYYVTGFMTPLGNGASVVEQVVSTTSGTLVFSVTNYITNLTDIAGQGDQLRAGILDRAQRGIQAFAAPPPTEDTPAPQASGADVNVNKIFQRKRGNSATSVALAPPPDSTLAILTVGGSSDFDQRSAAAKALAGAFEHAGRHAVISDADAPAPAVCTMSKATVLVGAWLDTPPPNAAAANSTLRMVAYDCNGNVAFDRTFKEPLASVTDAAVGAYLNPPKRRA